MGEKVVVRVFFRSPDVDGYGVAQFDIHPGDIRWEGAAGPVDPKEVYQLCLGTVGNPYEVTVDVFREGIL